MHFRLQEDHRRKKTHGLAEYTLDSSFIHHHCLFIGPSLTCSGNFFILQEALYILQEASVETTEGLKSSSKKNQRARNLSRRPVDLSSTIHPPNSPFHPYTTTFPLASFFPAQENTEILFLLFKKKNNEK